MRFEFNAKAYPPSQGREKWPDGWYKLIVNAHDIKPTPKGGSRISMTVLCIDGAFNGKENEMGFNIQNENTTTMQIAYEQLSALCYVTGKFNIQDLGELHNIPFFALCAQSEQGNNWRAFKDVNGNDAINIAKQTGGVTTRSAPAQQPPPAQVPFQNPAQQAPAGQPAWGAPPAGQPPAGQPQWGAPPAAPAAPAWGAPPAGAAPAWQAPPAQPAGAPPAGQWQPPAGQPPAQQPGGWTPPATGATPAGAPPWGAR